MTAKRIKSKMHLVLMVLVLTLVLTISNVSAFMPKNTHKLIWSRSVETPVNSPEYEACVKYPSLCYSGNVLTDVSVIFYYTQFGLYRVTHDVNFYKSLREEARNDQELACAVGAGTHQAQDMVSHDEGGLVPYVITYTGIVNNVIHVFSEQKVDNWVERNYPEVELQALNYMEDYEECIPLFKRVMISDPEYVSFTEQELEDKFDKFIQEIKSSQTGYDTAFKNKSFFVNIKAIPLPILGAYFLIMLFFTMVSFLMILKIFKGQGKFRHLIALPIYILIAGVLIYVFVGNLQGDAFGSFIKVIKPVSELVPLGATPEFYIDKAVDNTRQFFIEGSSFLEGHEPSGYTALGEADRKVILFDYVLLGILLLIFLSWTYYLLKSNKIKEQVNYTSSGNRGL